MDDIVSDTPFDRETCHRAMTDLSQACLVQYDEQNEVLLIERHMKHNPITNQGHADGAIKRLLDLPDCQPKIQRIQEVMQEIKLTSDQIKTLEKALKNIKGYDRAMTDLSQTDPTLTLTNTIKDKPPYTPPLKKNKRGSRWNEDEVPELWLAEARNKYSHWSADFLEDVVGNFCDYWKGVSGAKGVKMDWQATFRNTCRMQNKQFHKPDDPELKNILGIIERKNTA